MTVAGPDSAARHSRGVALDDAAREAARREIIALFAAGPFHTVGMREAAAHAGLGMATLYKYFGGKESMVVNALRPELEAMTDAMAEGSRTAVGTKARLQAVFAAMTGFALARMDAARAVWLNLPVCIWTADAHDWRTRRQGIVGHILRSGQHDGSVRTDVEDAALATLLLGAADARIEALLSEDAGFDSRREAARLFNDVWPLASA